MINITDAGLEKNSYEENLEYVYTIIQAEKGTNVDLSATGPWGQIAAILAKFISDNDDQQEEIYLSRDPDNATGIAQDRLSRETGTTRREASPTTVVGVLLEADEGTLIPVGKETGLSADQSPPADLTFTLDADVTVTKNSLRQVQFSLVDPSVGLLYSLTVNGEAVEYTAVSGDTLTSVITKLIADLPEEVVGTNVDDNLLVTGATANFIVTNNANLSADTLWGAGDFTASVVGAVSVPAGSLTEIITPVAGWSGVSNPAAGITGLERETDAALAIRRNAELVKGRATDAAIESGVGEVEGVSSVVVESNRTLSEVDGLPAKSFVTTVVGGSVDSIAQAIFDNMPSGIEPYGVGHEGTAVDDDGNEYTIPFSRPSTKYVWVRFTRTQHPEQTYPADGDAQVAAAVVAWAADSTISGTGIDIVRQKLGTPFFEVPGSDGVEIEIATTDTPSDTPTFVEDNIIRIGASQNTDYDESRIFVQEA